MLNAARLVDVGPEALQEAQGKLDALTAPKWWDRLVCTSRRAASVPEGFNLKCTTHRANS